MQKYSAKAIQHQSGSIDRELMMGKNYEIFTIPHYATGIHITEKGMDYLEDYVKQVRDVVGYEIPLAIDHFGHVSIEDCIKFAKRLEKYNIAWLEDIQPWHLTKHYEQIAAACNVPLATGEDIYLAKNFEPLMKNHADEMFKTEINLSKLAETYNRNEKYMGRLFKKSVGMSFAEYKQEKRLELAESLLVSGNDRIIDIALECGFNNISYFNRSFQKKYGSTPTEYRRRKSVRKPKKSVKK